ncbi:MAG: hypothetical protein AB1489_37685, partial [Acidobacteriota bacterium]
MSAISNSVMQSGWIINRRSDIAFIFGGAAASLTAPLLVMWQPALLPLLFWAWLFFFDGTHMWAAYSRTYIDKKYWRTDGRLLAISLLTFLPALAVCLVRQVTGSKDAMDLFLVFAQGWGYYHIVRQHYGFVSLYDRKSSASRQAHLVNKWVLYIGLWTPYLYFLIAHPLNRRIANLPVWEKNNPWYVALTVLAIVISILSFLFLLFYN